ncbi:MAG: hydrogenase expression/formation protein HypE [Desulfovibrionaceae bacterium]
MSDKVLLDYGSGGRASQRLISDLFVKHLGNPELERLNDAALLAPKGRISISTDTFTVDPIFFPGGDIGRLAVHGTVNDVAMLGAVPRWLSCAYILEEGLPMADLERIVASMGEAARHAGVNVVTGDTKVVPRGAVDKIFINTTGVGEVIKEPTPAGDRARPGDAVIISGTMGDHGLTILGTREGLSFEADVRSDCASLNHLLVKLVRELPDVHVLRDPTRGGLATTLNEIAASSKAGIDLQETAIPVRPAVAGGCQILGMDPLYLANEGKFICIVPGEDADRALAIMRADELGQDAARIGTVTAENPGKVILTTQLGGKRLLNMLEGEQLPRIC